MTKVWLLNFFSLATMAKKAVSPVVTINVIYNVGMLQCYNITTMYAVHYTHIMQGNSWAPGTSAHGVKRIPTERMK